MDRTSTVLSLGIFVACVLTTAQAQTGGGFDLSWSTLDGGGQTFSTGGGFELGGTIGQLDAQPSPVMAGGAFTLIGGFWPVAQVCYCLGDMNGDGRKDGGDVQRFVDCVISGGACSCADVDAANGVTISDVGVFVSDLLDGTSCPS